MAIFLESLSLSKDGIEDQVHLLNTYIKARGADRCTTASRRISLSDGEGGLYAEGIATEETCITVLTRHTRYGIIKQQQPP